MRMGSPVCEYGPTEDECDGGGLEWTDGAGDDPECTDGEGDGRDSEGMDMSSGGTGKSVWLVGSLVLPPRSSPGVTEADMMGSCFSGSGCS